jgi:hypothetical protein
MMHLFSDMTDEVPWLVVILSLLTLPLTLAQCQYYRALHVAQMLYKIEFDTAQNIPIVTHRFETTIVAAKPE